MSSCEEPQPIQLSRQNRLNRAFVTLSDSLVQGFDVHDVFDLLVRTCVDVLEVDSAGVLLSDGWGRLKIAASSSAAMEALDLLALQAEEGPCVQSFHTGRPVAVSPLDRTQFRWPTFTPAAITAGYSSVQALPLRLRTTNIGALNLFHRRAHTMPEDDVQAAQALADVATIAVLHDLASRNSNELVNQLQHALDSRVLIEQATGRLAELGGLTGEQAFDLLRSYSRAHRQKIADIAGRLVTQTLTAGEVIAATR